MHYFSLSGKNLSNVGIAEVSSDFDDYAFWDDLESRRTESDWKKIATTLVPWKEAQEANAPDLLSSNLLPRLCSARLREVLTPFSDDLLWLPIAVEDGDRSLEYSILHFRDFPDILDKERSEFVGGRLLYPHLDSSKLKGRHIAPRDPLALSWFVSDDAREAIVDSKCTGIEFEKVGVT